MVIHIVTRGLLIVLVLITEIAACLPVHHINSGYGRTGTLVLYFLDKEYRTNYTDPLTLEVNLTFANGTPIPNVYVKFYIIIDSEKSFIGGNYTEENGYAECRIQQIQYAPGEYDINATAEYSGEYVEASTHLYINREDTLIETSRLQVQYTDNTTLEARLHTDDGDPVPGAILKLYLVYGGEMIGIAENTTGFDGRAIFTISTKRFDWISVGTYDLIIVFNGSKFYNPSSTKSLLNVTREKLSVMVSTVGKAVVGGSVIIVVKVIDDDGEPVPFAEIRIFIDGDLVGIGRTDSDGVYGFSWSPENPGRYEILVKVHKDNYEDAESNFILDVEGPSGGYQLPMVFIVVLVFLIVAILIAIFARR